MMLVKAGDGNAVAAAADAVMAGGLIIYPTDTIYGIGADARSEDAVSKAEKLKGRDGKPMSIVVSGIEMAAEYCEVSACARKYWKLMPGPYTFVLARKRKPKGAKGIAANAAGESIGVRVPDNEFPLALVRELGFPIISTSANYCGGKEPSEVSGVEKGIMEKVAVVVDGGKCREGKASTVIDMRGKEPIVLRAGAGHDEFKGMQKNIL